MSPRRVSASMSTISLLANPLLSDTKTIGYPLDNLKAVPAGDYEVQAVFNVFEQFHLADGRNLCCRRTRAKASTGTASHGNPVQRSGEAAHRCELCTPIKLTLDKVIPPIEGTDQDPVVMAAKAPASKWLKFVRFKSEKLSKFWGRDMYLGAWGAAARWI